MIGLLGEKMFKEGEEPVLSETDIKPGMALNYKSNGG
jgi:hypothetical protein